jgi:hypothetical protein
MNDNGYTVVSGCPRSGTSLMMDIHRVLYGDDLILGHKFPQKQREEALREAIDDEIDELREYFIKKNLKHREMEIPQEQREFEDMNPNGFWECVFSVQGIKYSWMVRDELSEVMKKRKIVKVVSQGLLNSDTKYINRIVYMIRHPRAVAKSQERLKREFLVTDAEGNTHNLYHEDWVIHTPEMFISVTTQAIQFLLENRDIPIIMINFESLISNPSGEIMKVYEFNDMGGNIDEAIDTVEPHLNRSQQHEPVENKLWGDAEYLYSVMNKFKNYKEDDENDKAYKLLEDALVYIQDPIREIVKDQRNYRCYRAKTQTNYENCVKCMTDMKYRKNLIERSEATPAQVADHWMFEPCVFQCGLDPHRKNHLTIEESVEDNFWYDHVELDLDKERS